MKNILIEIDLKINKTNVIIKTITLEGIDMSKELIYQYVKQFTAGRIASGFSHSHRVYHIARELGVDNYDEEILHAACYLHDTVIGYDSHTKSAEKAEQILREVGFPATKIDQVVEAIAQPGETPKQLKRSCYTMQTFWIVLERLVW